jgi:transposase-like protein
MFPFFSLEFSPLGLAANALERLGGEVKRASDFIDIFPSIAAFVSLAVALLDQNDEGQSSVVTKAC